MFRCNSKANTAKNKKPVIVTHGLLLSSDDFCINPPNQALGDYFEIEMIDTKYSVKFVKENILKRVMCFQFWSNCELFHGHIAYILADADYDVWLPNSRGTLYSRRHSNVSIDPNDIFGSYWNFSWYEMGVYDQPVSSLRWIEY